MKTQIHLQTQNFPLTGFALFVVFGLSFFQYVVDSRFVVGTTGLVLLLFVGGVSVAANRIRRDHSSPMQAGRATFASRDGLLFAIVVPLLPLAMSIYNDSDYSVSYGLIFLAACVAIRGVAANVPLTTIVRAYGFAGICSAAVILPSLLENILGARERFTPFTFHPNLIGFLMVPVPPIAIWLARSKPTIIRLSLYFFGVIVPFAIVYQASSRGSLVALVVSLAIAAAIYDFLRHTNLCARRTRSSDDLRFLAKWLMIVSIGGIIFWQPAEFFFGDSEFTEQLDIFSKYRGLDTGLTGRVEAWATLLESTAGWSALLGNGFRASDQLLTFDVDNGILVMLYDFGAPLTVVIVGRFVYVALVTARLTFRSACLTQVRFGVLLIAVLVGFLLNNITSRHMFGIGNPFSLLGLFFFLAPARSLGLAISHMIPDRTCQLRLATMSCRNNMLALAGEAVTTSRRSLRIPIIRNG